MIFQELVSCMKYSKSKVYGNWVGDGWQKVVFIGWWTQAVFWWVPVILAVLILSYLWQSENMDLDLFLLSDNFHEKIFITLE